MTAPAAPAATSLDVRYARWDGPGLPFRLVRARVAGEPGPGELLVRVDLATVCGSDVHTALGHRPSPAPGVLGHEQVGRVLAVGPAVPAHADGVPVRVGDRLVWSVAASCGRCPRCRRSIPQKCLELRKFGHEPLDAGRAPTGGFATHCLLPAGTSVVRVPDEVPDVVAAPAACATATVAAALEAAGAVGEGTRVLVTGAGMLGVTAAAMAACRGADVVVSDPDPARREGALRFGAGAAVTGAPRDRVHDVALELSGAPAAVAACVDGLDVGGVAVLAGSVSPGPGLQIDPERVVRGLHTIVGVHNYAPRHLRAAVEFLTARHRDFPFHELVGGTYPLAELDAAVAAATAAGAAPRQAVVPGG